MNLHQRVSFLWLGTVLGVPMYLSFHKGIQTFVSRVNLPFVCWCLVTRKVFRKPCTSPPHKGVRAFVRAFLSLPCVLMRLVRGKVSGNHVPLLFTTTFKLLCLVCLSLPLVSLFALWLGVDSGLPMHLSFSQTRSNTHALFVLCMWALFPSHP